MNARFQRAKIISLYLLSMLEGHLVIPRRPEKNRKDPKRPGKTPEITRKDPKRTPKRHPKRPEKSRKDIFIVNLFIVYLFVTNRSIVIPH